MVQIARTLSKPARLALCSRSPVPGAVDGAWWPSSPNLRKELPDLLAVLGMSIGPVHRVVYDPSMWPDPPSRIIRGTAITSLDPYTLHARDTLYFIGTHSRDAVLFVVPPAIPVAVVHRVLRAVSSQAPLMCVTVLRQLVDRFAAEARRSPVT